MRLARVADPAPGPGEVVVQVAVCGVCGSDVEGYAGSPGMKSRRVPPLLLGHEFSGVVQDGPPEWAGRPVAVNPLVPCGDCAECRAGRRHLCPERSLIGLNRPGAFASHVVVPISQLYLLAADAEVERGALAEPLAVALHAVETAGPLLGRAALVLGGGAIGFLTAWAARRTGAHVRVVEPNPLRRALLERLGVDAVPGPPGEPAHVVFDAVGLEETRRAGLEAVLPGGTVVLLGLHDNRSTVEFYPLILKELRVIGSYTYTDLDFRRAVALVSELPTAFYTVWPLQRGPAAFEQLARGDAPVLKVLLKPDPCG